MDILIRQESVNDFIEIYNLVKKSFETSEHSDGDEQDLVDRLRNTDAYIPELALVAEISGKIAGHIMFTKVTVGETIALAVGPLSVIPEFQSKGVGSMLINVGHHIAKKMGYEFSILVGHSNYYPRFGYITASTLGIKATFEVPDENFMVYNLQGRNTRLEGIVDYPKEWNIK